MTAPVSIPESVSLAFHAMVLLATRNRESRMSLGMLSVGEASLDHLSKVLQKLVRAGLITSKRGARGGFRLALPPGKITLMDIWRAMEGDSGYAQCPLHDSGCPLSGCVFGNLIEETNGMFDRDFTETTLEDFSRGGSEKDDC